MMISFLWGISRILWVLVLVLGAFIVVSFVDVRRFLGGHPDETETIVILLFGPLAPLAVGKLSTFTMWKHKGTYLNGHETLIIKRPWFMSACFATSLLMFISGLIRLSTAENGNFGLTLAIYAVVLVPVLWMALIQPQLAKLTLSPRGLDYSLFKIGLIDWCDIREVRIAGTRHGAVIALDILDEQKYLDRGFKPLPSWMRAFVPSLFMVRVSTFGVSPEWLRTAIQVRLEAFGRCNASASPTIHRQGMTA